MNNTTPIRNIKDAQAYYSRMKTTSKPKDASIMPAGMSREDAIRAERICVSALKFAR